jgi:hypothetical protein
MVTLTNPYRGAIVAGIVRKSQPSTYLVYLKARLTVWHDTCFESHHVHLNQQTLKEEVDEQTGRKSSSSNGRK